MDVDTFLGALQGTPVSQAVAESGWIFPTVESIHVAAITLVVGSILVVDLRLIGLVDKARSAREIETRFLPITWIAFAMAALSGSTLFLAKPLSYGHNPFFLAKLWLLGFAAVNMLAFHLIVQRRAGHRDYGFEARVSGGLSLALWIGIVAVGRWTGFTL